MTTDPFTEAARAYARKRYPTGSDLDRDRRMVVDEFIEWVRIHLAAQEPTDAEVEAAAKTAYEYERMVIDPEWPEWDCAGEAAHESTREMVRAALSTARANRRDEKGKP